MSAYSGALAFPLGDGSRFGSSAAGLDARNLARYIDKIVAEFEEPASRHIEFERGHKLSLISSEIFLISRSLKGAHQERFRHRLAEILDPRDWQDEENLPKLASFKECVAFLNRNSKFLSPSVFVTPAGNFILSWRKGRNALFSVEFLGSGIANWMLYRPIEPGSDDREQVAGRTRIDKLLKRVQGIDSLEWMRKQ